MADIIIATGYVGRDAESRFTSQGAQVTTFSLALNRGYGDKKSTVWARVTTWRKTAEICAQYVTKGMLVQVTGQVQEPRCYQAKDGTWKAGQLEISAQHVEFLGGKSDAATQQGANDMGDGVTEIDDLSDVPF